MSEIKVKETASLSDVKVFFDFPNIPTFKNEWNELSKGDQKEIRDLIFIEIS